MMNTKMNHTHLPQHQRVPANHVRQQQIQLVPLLILLSLLLLSACPAPLQTGRVEGTVAMPSASPKNRNYPTVIQRIPFSAWLVDFRYDAARGRLYITDQSGTFTVIDSNTYQSLATTRTVTESRLRLAPDGQSIYLLPNPQSATDAAITVIDTTRLTVTATISQATDITFDTTRNQLIVGNRASTFAGAPSFSDTPASTPVAALRILDAETFAPIQESALAGRPLYNAYRDEILLLQETLYRVARGQLTIVEDLFPAIREQPCSACVGAQYVENAELIAESNLLAITIATRSIAGEGMRPVPLFLDATTLKAIQPQPERQATCAGHFSVQPQIANRIYRHRAIAATYLFHNWSIEATTGQRLRTIDGLDAPFINPNTAQAYAGGWALSLPALLPIGRLPNLTCIFAHDLVTGRIFAQYQNELVVLAEEGGGQTATGAPVTVGLPNGPGTAIPTMLTAAGTATRFAVQGEALYRSDDGGTTWLPLTHLSLFGVMPLHVVLSPTYAEDETLYVGGGNRVGAKGTLAGGVFRSTDGGNSWAPLWTGLDYLRIEEVAMKDGALVAIAHMTDLERNLSGYAVQRFDHEEMAWSLWYTTTTATTPVDLMSDILND